jgi:hypothetical protein
MNGSILQTSFKVRIPRDDYETLCAQIARQIAAVPGLLWKAWVFDETRSEAGGVYLFESKHALRAFVDGPIIANLRTNPAFENVKLRTLELLGMPSVITRFPVPAWQMALAE